MSGTIKGIEEITIPAGKFWAVKVEGETLYRGKACKSTEWYVADMGCVKLVSELISMEMTKFTPAKK